MFESTPKTQKKSLAENFQDLALNPAENGSETIAFESLENTLFVNGFSLAGSIEVSEIIKSEALLCRSENFTKVLNLIETDSDLEIKNTQAHANMCTMSAGSGFKVAMLEGFSGNDVGNVVKVVISFSGEHLKSRIPTPKEDELWKTKPQTAAVSLAGEGVVTKEDLQMVSFRFPERFFPEKHLTEEEKDWLEEEKVSFIVRHYVPNKMPHQAI